ncbi:hypothetical protein [Ancylomarina sp.]|uniref:hypothetical protein n=1 Tax=Ancylomarina sp. TaxID=1970196 RepID=UPI0035665CB2
MGNRFFKTQILLACIFITTTSLAQESQDTKRSPSPIKNHFQTGVLLGSSNNQNKAPFSLMYSSSYLFKNQFLLGLGIAYESFREAQMPIFVRLEHPIKHGDVDVFAFTNMGYSFNLENRKAHNYQYSNLDFDSKGGWLINPGMGIKLRVGSSSKLLLSIGYRYQKIKHKAYNTYTLDNEIHYDSYNRISLHLGLEF